MKRAAIILARLDSERFPQKALYEIEGKALIEWCIDSLKPDNEYEIILTTTNRKVDDPLEVIAKKNNIKCFRGDTHNVAKRVIDCIDYFNIDYFARVNGDSPFINRELLLNGFNIIENKNVDFVTNLVPRRFPYGISVEIFKSNFYKTSLNNVNDQKHLEHVTSYFYENIDNFNPYCIQYTGGNDQNIRLVIDVPEDIEMIKKLIKKIGKENTMTIEKIVTFYKKEKQNYHD